MIVVGIDLGTSNSTICYFDSYGNPNIITDNESHNISSMIGFTTYGNVFGNKAVNITDNNIFISNIKRLIGYNYLDLSEEYLNQFSFDIINNNGLIGIKINDKIYSPNELMIYFLNYLKQLIETKINQTYKVIVTVPAYFNIQQKEAINDCIITAGFDIIKLLSEPTSASIAYGYYLNFNDDDNVLVFDLGGGTLDLSIINISKNDDNLEKSYQVLATYGDNKFGGSDLTFQLIKFIKSKYPEYDLEENNNLFKYIDNLKINLNNGFKQDTIQINDYNITINEDEFNLIINNWLTKNSISDGIINNNINEVLKIANLDREDINHILLVGGTSKIKQVRNTLNTYFKKEIKSYYMNNSNISLEDIAVSYGSALHGYIMYSSKNLVLIDVCPFNIGIETIGGLMVPIISSNSKIPIKRTKQFSTDEDNITEVKIKIFQGDSGFTNNNIFLGEFTLSGIPKASKGVPVINILIEINNNGLLRVTANDRKHLTTNEITIHAKDYKLNDIDISEIKERIEKNKESENILLT